MTTNTPTVTEIITELERGGPAIAETLYDRLDPETLHETLKELVAIARERAAIMSSEDLDVEMDRFLYRTISGPLENYLSADVLEKSVAEQQHLMERLAADRTPAREVLKSGLQPRTPEQYAVLECMRRVQTAGAVVTVERVRVEAQKIVQEYDQSLVGLDGYRLPPGRMGERNGNPLHGPAAERIEAWLTRMEKIKTQGELETHLMTADSIKLIHAGTLDERKRAAIESAGVTVERRNADLYVVPDAHRRGTPGLAM